MSEQLTINTGTEHVFAASFITLGDLVIRDKNTTYTLNPIKDLTAYELYHINRFVELCKLNYMGQSENVDRLIEEIYANEISRHFDIK